MQKLLTAVTELSKEVKDLREEFRQFRQSCRCGQSESVVQPLSEPLELPFHTMEALDHAEETLLNGTNRQAMVVLVTSLFCQKTSLICTTSLNCLTFMTVDSWVNFTFHISISPKNCCFFSMPLSIQVTFRLKKIIILHRPNWLKIMFDLEALYRGVFHQSGIKKSKTLSCFYSGVT